MILLLAIGIGLLAGYLRARLGGRTLVVPNLRWLWVVPIAFVPQLIAFQLPATRYTIPERWIPLALICSQLLLVVFVAANLRQPGFWLLGAGLLLNLIVISQNGGWMPISPETVRRLAPNAPPRAWEIGKRLGFTKDKVIQQSETNLWFLSDQFVAPSWLPYHFAFSIGDILIAIGAIWFLWSLGGTHEPGQI